MYKMLRNVTFQPIQRSKNVFGIYKIFRSSHGCFTFNPILKNHLRCCKFYLPMSLFHSLTKILARDSKLEFILNEVEELRYSKSTNGFSGLIDIPKKGELSKVQISHPWPEWVGLMEYFLERGYFDGEGNPFRNNELGAKESNLIRTTCLNFGRDRFDLLRFLSRKDIQVIVGHGCPSLDRKVVNSGKRLRTYVGIDEGNVCRACYLRGDCERAFVKARKDESGRTVDLMRIILTFGLDPIIGSIENKPCLNKMVKESVRKLVKELVETSIGDDSSLPNATKRAISRVNLNPQYKGNTEISMKQGDWCCPKCNFINFARNIKCLCCDGLFQERIRQLWMDQDNLPMKKGDWICNKCNFLNFAKNTRCLQCKEKPPKRQLNPGEWECNSCNYINFRRNMVCLKCDHKRPKASNASDSSHQGNINDQTSMLTETKNRNRGLGMWRFVEETNENHHCPYSWNDTSQFTNFPIAGGKSDLSKNSQKIEFWKKEMVKRSKSSLETSKSEDEFWSADIRSNKETFYCTDDEEMAGWFGMGKGERNKISGSE